MRIAQSPEPSEILKYLQANPSIDDATRLSIAESGIRAAGLEPLLKAQGKTLADYRDVILRTHHEIGRGHLGKLELGDKVAKGRELLASGMPREVAQYLLDAGICGKAPEREEYPSMENPDELRGPSPEEIAFSDDIEFVQVGDGTWAPIRKAKPAPNPVAHTSPVERQPVDTPPSNPPRDQSPGNPIESGIQGKTEGFESERTVWDRMLNIARKIVGLKPVGAPEPQDARKITQEQEKVPSEDAPEPPKPIESLFNEHHRNICSILPAASKHLESIYAQASDLHEQMVNLKPDDAWAFHTLQIHFRNLRTRLEEREPHGRDADSFRDIIVEHAKDMLNSLVKLDSFLPGVGEDGMLPSNKYPPEVVAKIQKLRDDLCSLITTYTTIEEYRPPLNATIAQEYGKIDVDGTVDAVRVRPRCIAVVLEPGYIDPQGTIPVIKRARVKIAR